MKIKPWKRLVLCAILATVSRLGLSADSVWITDVRSAATVNEWNPVPYETQDGIRGTLAYAPGTLPTGRRVEIPLKACGNYRIWLALGGLRWSGTQVYVRLKGEPVPVRMCAAFNQKDAEQRMQPGELEYRELKLKGDETLVVEHITGASGFLAWIRLEPIASVHVPCKDGPGMISTIDAFYPYANMEQFFEPMRFVADSPVRKIFFCVGNGSQTFALPSKVAYTTPCGEDLSYGRAYDRDAAKAFARLHAEHPRLLDEAIDYAHGLGLEFHVSFRTGCFVDHMRFSEKSGSSEPGADAQNIRTPANCCRLWDGTPVARYSYASRDVQDFFLKFYAEALDSKADGIHLIFTRAFPAILFEPAFRDRFRARYGEELASTNDARIVELRCAVMTDLLRCVKKLAGSRPLALTLLGSVALNREFGVDVAQLAREGIVDEFIFDGDVLARPRALKFEMIDFRQIRAALAGTKATFRAQMLRWWDGLAPQNFRTAVAAGSNGFALWDGASTPWQDWERLRRMRPDDFSEAERWAKDHPDANRVHPFKTFQGFDAVTYPWWVAY